MQLFLGIDAGGTKTKARIINEQGLVLGEGTGLGANPHNQPLEKVLTNLGLAVLSAKKQMEDTQQVLLKEFSGACIGMAGLDTEADRSRVISGLHAGMFRKWCEATGLILVNDGFIGLRSGVTHNYGVCIISGTGSNCYGISPSGAYAQAGDWGFVLGDQGSGYAMGRALLRHIMKEYDGRENPSILSSKILQHLNLNNHSELIDLVYGESVPVREIAGITKLFDDQEVSDYYIVDQIIDQAIQSQKSAFMAVTNKLEFEDEFPVVLTGGLMNLETDHFVQKLKTAIEDSSDQAQVIVSTHEPIEGALALAKEVPQLRDDPVFQKFMVSW